MATTTIINKATYDAEYADKSGSSLMFDADFFDCLGYVDRVKLRKKLNLKGRGKLVAVLLRRMDDPLFINVANKDIVYKNPVLVDRSMDGATTTAYGNMWATNHPIGNAIVVLKE
jgi:hypothetical protein